MYRTGTKAEQCHKNIKTALQMISEYRWLSDAYVSDFFTKELWRKVNVKWWKTLCLLDPEELASLLSAETWKSRYVWPLSLLAYRSTIHTLSLKNTSETDFNQSDKRSEDSSSFHCELNGYDSGQLEHCFKRHVKPKKQHEIMQLAEVVSELSRQCNSKQVLDIGAGQGHLSRLLSFRHGLDATTIEAAGCHSPKAEKFDKEVKSDILKGRIHSKKQQRNILEQNTKSTVVTNQVPNHVTATIQPDISVDDFLSHVTKCLEEKHRNREDLDKSTLTGNKSFSQLSKDLAEVKLSDSMHNQDHACLNSDSKGDKYGNTRENTDHICGDNTENHMIQHLAVAKNTGAYNSNVFQNYQRPECNKFEENNSHNKVMVSCNCQTKQSKLSPSKVLAENCDSTFEGTASQSQTKDMDSQDLDIEYGKTTTFKRNQNENQSFVITGLHACGDLTSTILRMFVKCDQLTGLASVGCCYMKLTTSTSDEDLGYPMSLSVKSLPDHHLSYEALEMACHFIDAYHKRLLDNSANLHSHCYRATLQEIIQEKNPDFIHGCIKVTIKNSEHMNFKQYAEKALKRLGLDTALSISQMEKAEERLQEWKKVVAFYTLRLSLGPLLETIVLLDRVIYLQENGIHGELTPIFDPILSPRNFALIAMK